MLQGHFSFPPVEAIDITANMKGTTLEMIQAPVLTRWWTVGIGADYLFKYYLPVLRACQIVINRYKSDARPNKIASALYSLMTNPNNLADLSLIKCFNEGFVHRHLDWMQSSVDLSGIHGFQAHQMAIRFFYMQSDIDDMFDNTFKGFEDYREIVKKLDDHGYKLQQTKEELFIQACQVALEKHFPRWLSTALLPAALLSETDTARMIAALMLQDHQFIQYYERSTKFFYSDVHERRIPIKSFVIFLYKHTKSNDITEYAPQAMEAAEKLLEGWDLRCKDLDDCEDDQLSICKFMFATYLPLASHTQFVEFGVKEAKLVAQTNR